MNTPKQSHTLSAERGAVFSFLFIIILIGLMVAAALYTYQLNSTIITKFENRRWDIPATVYSRPLTLVGDTKISAQDLEAWLNLLHYDTIASQNDIDKKTGTYHKTGNTYYIHTRGFDYGDGDVDSPEILRIQTTGGMLSRTQSSNANTKARLEPVNIGGIYPDSNEDRLLITQDNTPQALIDALIATEDRDFYNHGGISMRGTTRALFNNLTGGSMQGGSTLTQQLIKNFYLNSERSLKRKVNEAIMATLLERHYSKDDILLAYMNEINLGQNGNRSVNGFGIASQFYFNKPLSELRLDQYALLVGVAKGPSYYNPRKHPERATERRNVVLNNMLLTGKISQESYDTATKKPLDVVATPTIAKSRFPDFLDLVQRELNTRYRPDDLKNAGLRIVSTLDPIAQTAADKAMAGKLTQLERNNRRAKNLEGALISADPHTGALLALVGSGGEFTGFNRALDAKRQVGSLLKPVIYLTALQSGRYNLASGVNDSPVGYKAGGRSWTPKNYNGVSHGTVPLTEALANSYNQAAVNVGMEFGVDIFNKQLRQMGIDNDLPNYPSALLGSAELSPMQALGVYQVLATGGVHNPLYSIDTVIDEKGRILQKAQLQGQARLPSEAVYLTDRAMQGVISHGTAKAAASLGKGLAGKTGTTNDNKDAWFAGYSGNYVTVVWVGRDDNATIGLTGGSGALPIWVDYMKRLKLTATNMPAPKGIEWGWLENGTGALTLESCPNAVHTPIISKFMPTELSLCAQGISPDEVPQDESAITDEAQVGEPPISQAEIERMNADKPANTPTTETANPPSAEPVEEAEYY
ncbi:MAG: penicillin-binding protein 1B [Moraxella sp.]|nr:penicillin-binding protein 1B [Moraxella sp.]